MDFLIDQRIKAAITPLIARILTLEDQVKSLTSELQMIRPKQMSRSSMLRENNMSQNQTEVLVNYRVNTVDGTTSTIIEILPINEEVVKTLIDQPFNDASLGIYGDMNSSHLIDANTDPMPVTNQTSMKTEEIIEAQQQIMTERTKQNQKFQITFIPPKFDKLDKLAKFHSQTKAKSMSTLMKGHQKITKIGKQKQKQKMDKSGFMLKIQELKPRKASDQYEKVNKSTIITKQKIETSKIINKNTKEPTHKDKIAIKSTENSMKKSYISKQAHTNSDKKNDQSKLNQSLMHLNQESEISPQKMKKTEEKQLKVQIPKININIDDLREKITLLIKTLDKMTEIMPQSVFKIEKNQCERLMLIFKNIQNMNLQELREWLLEIISKMMISSQLKEAKSRIQHIVNILTVLMSILMKEMQAQKTLLDDDDGIQITNDMAVALMKLREMINMMTSDWRDMLMEDLKMIKLSINMMNELIIKEDTATLEKNIEVADQKSNKEMTEISTK